MIKVKICGLTDEKSVDAAAAAGATWAGFVHFEPSPRHVTLERAGALAEHASKAGLKTVLVVVDPPKEVAFALQDGLLGIDGIQLHGGESPEEAMWIKNYTARHLTKALPARARADLAAAERFVDAANVLLIDAKPPDGSHRPGGHGAPFDWTILEGWDAPKPWLLSGGLTPSNVAEAIRVTGARAVDVSSGVESAPGVKDASLIRDFVQAAQQADEEARA